MLVAIIAVWIGTSTASAAVPQKSTFSAAGRCLRLGGGYYSRSFTNSVCSNDGFVGSCPQGSRIDYTSNPHRCVKSAGGPLQAKKTPKVAGSSRARCILGSAAQIAAAQANVKQSELALAKASGARKAFAQLSVDEAKAVLAALQCKIPSGGGSSKGGGSKGGCLPGNARQIELTGVKLKQAEVAFAKASPARKAAAWKVVENLRAALTALMCKDSSGGSGTVPGCANVSFAKLRAARLRVSRAQGYLILVEQDPASTATQKQAAQAEVAAATSALAQFKCAGSPGGGSGTGGCTPATPAQIKAAEAKVKQAEQAAVQGRPGSKKALDAAKAKLAKLESCRATPTPPAPVPPTPVPPTPVPPTPAPPTPGGGTPPGSGTPQSTSTSMVCSPPEVLLRAPTTCTATVTNANANSTSTPTGTVRFTAALGIFGSGGVCTLAAKGSSASCSLSYTPGTGLPPVVTDTVVASYAGDATHKASRGTTQLPVYSIL